MSIAVSSITQGSIVRQMQVEGFRLTHATHEPKRRLPRHDHANANLVFVIKGCFLEQFDTSCYECAPNQLIIKPAGMAHSNIYGAEAVHCLAIEITPSRRDLSPFRALLNDVKFHASHPCVGHVRKICVEIRQPDTLSPIVIEGMVLETLACLCRLEQQRAPFIPEWLNRAKEYLHDQFTSSPSLSEVASAAGVHPVHLAREFRRRFRSSIGKYLRKLRVEMACRLLTGSRRSLIEIAYQSGFADQSHFTRVFKTIMGVTPSAYRTMKL